MTPFQEQHLRVTRTARYFTHGPRDASVREVWFALHGYGQLATYFIRHFYELDDGRRLIVVPEALSRFYLQGTDGRIGAAWMTREDRLHEIDDYVSYLDALHDHIFAQTPRQHVQLHVLGFSQGAATACRWLANAHARADRLILWGGHLPPDVDLDVHRTRFQRLNLTLVFGTRDQYATPEVVASLEARLQQHAIPYQILSFEGDHRLDAPTLRRLAANQTS